MALPAAALVEAVKHFVSPYRAEAHAVISRVLEATRGQDEKAVRKALREAYPFGERHYWPYKIWCDEVKRMLGTSGFQTKDKPAQKGAYRKLREWEELYGPKPQAPDL